jgi:hypothetical protein
MEQVKIFRVKSHVNGDFVDDYEVQLEKNINTWLQNNKDVIITRILQSTGGTQKLRETLVSIYYIKNS